MTHTAARTAETGAPRNSEVPEDAPDAGFTMMEMLVAMALFAALGSVLIGFAMGSSRVADDVRESSNVVGEARRPGGARATSARPPSSPAPRSTAARSSR